MGMMQVVECTDRPEDANYNPRTDVTSADMPVHEVDAIYPRPSLELMYRQTLSFIDPSPIGGYEFPGFDLQAPVLKD